MANKKSEEVKNLIEATNMMVGLHVQAYNAYMELTDNNEALSLKLSKDYISALLNMGVNQNNDSQKNLLF